MSLRVEKAIAFIRLKVTTPQDEWKDSIAMEIIAHNKRYLPHEITTKINGNGEIPIPVFENLRQAAGGKSVPPVSRLLVLCICQAWLSKKAESAKKEFKHQGHYDAPLSLA